MTIEVSGFESLLWAGGTIAFLVIAFRKAGKIHDEKHPNTRPYTLSDRGWTDEHNRFNYSVTDFNILQRDEHTGEWNLIYKGAATGEDSRPALYMDHDVDHVDPTGSIHFKDGFVLDQSSISTTNHKYFDSQSQFAAFSREWEAPKYSTMNGKPSLAHVARFDIVDIRHLDSSDDYMIFTKGTCPSKWQKHLVTGVSAEGPITKVEIKRYKEWGMEPPQPITQDSRTTISSPFPWED